MNLAALTALLNGDFNNALIASTPGGIEAQEKKGQTDLVAALDRLPTRLNSHYYGLDEISKRLGFKFGEPLPDDPLFRAVTFPPGWTLRATNHSMHSDLLDPQGRMRGTVFYKAAFYDRQADWNLCCRYVSFSEYRPTEIAVGVMDKADGTWVFQAGEVARDDRMSDDELRALLAEHDRLTSVSEKWLSEQYPDHCNVFTYWD